MDDLGIALALFIFLYTLFREKCMSPKIELGDIICVNNQDYNYYQIEVKNKTSFLNYSRKPAFMVYAINNYYDDHNMNIFKKEIYPKWSHIDYTGIIIMGNKLHHIVNMGEMKNAQHCNIAPGEIRHIDVVSHDLSNNIMYYWDLEAHIKINLNKKIINKDKFFVKINIYYDGTTESKSYLFINNDNGLLFEEVNYYLSDSK